MPEDIHWQKYSQRFKTFPAMLEHRETSAKVIVCIPVLAEPDLISTLESLRQCDMPQVQVDVLLFFNKNNRMTAEELAIHENAWVECKRWTAQHQVMNIDFKPIYLDQFPDPKGGVGWARKLVMDEAARMISQEGIILCLDADCIVSKNYLNAIYNFFQLHPTFDAASVYFEHDLNVLDSKTRLAIVEYELHLRYLVHANRWVGHPFAFHTIGSSMAVRRKAYMKHGGMNTRQAGEDFYFLQKFIEVGTLREIKSTCVFPSPRISARVPFGTGKAMQKLLGESVSWMTTDFETFRLIKPLFHSLENIWTFFRSADSILTYDRLQEIMGIHPIVMDFLERVEFIPHCISIEKHTTGFSTFRKRFFRYFNAFMMIRYMHYIRDKAYPDIPVSYAAQELSKELGFHLNSSIETEQLLLEYRRLDRMES